MNVWNENKDEKSLAIIMGSLIVLTSVIVYGAIVIKEICANVGGNC